MMRQNEIGRNDLQGQRRGTAVGQDAGMDTAEVGTVSILALIVLDGQVNLLIQRALRRIVEPEHPNA